MIPMKDYRNILKSNADIDKVMIIDEEQLWDTIQKKIKSPEKNRKRLFIWWFPLLFLLMTFACCMMYYFIEPAQSFISPNIKKEVNKQLVYSENNNTKSVATDSDVPSMNLLELENKNQKFKVDKTSTLDISNTLNENSSYNFPNKEEQNNTQFHQTVSDNNPLKKQLLNNLPKENVGSNFYKNENINPIVDIFRNDKLIDQTVKNKEVFSDSGKPLISSDISLGRAKSRILFQAHSIEKISEQSIFFIDAQLIDKNRMTVVNHSITKPAYKLSLNIDLSAYYKSYQSKTDDLTELFSFKRRTELSLEGFNLKLTYSKSIFNPNLYVYAGLNLTRLNEKFEHNWTYTDNTEELLQGQRNLIQVNARYFNYYLFFNAPIGIEYDLAVDQKFSISAKAGINVNLYKSNVGEYFDIDTNNIRSKNNNVIVENNRLGIHGFHLNVGIDYEIRPRLSCQANFGFNKYSNEISAGTTYTESFFIYSFGLGVNKKF